MDLAISQMREDRQGLGGHAALSYPPECMHLTIAGDLESAFEARTKLDAMHERQLTEASVYDTTTRMSLGRELGTLGELGRMAGVMETMGHPASAARSLHTSA